jgi:hypothetical protein
MTLDQMIREYFWHLFFLMACAWYFGFVSGKWWQEEKTKEQSTHNDEMWW